MTMGSKWEPSDQQRQRLEKAAARGTIVEEVTGLVRAELEAQAVKFTVRSAGKRVGGLVLLDDQKEPLAPQSEELLLLLETGALYDVGPQEPVYWAQAAERSLLSTQVALAELSTRGLAVAEDGNWRITLSGAAVAKAARLREIDEQPPSGS